MRGTAARAARVYTYQDVLEETKFQKVEKD